MRQIAIDGPAGSGKGTVTKLVAERCNLIYIDTGVTYRCVALSAIENNIDITFEDDLVEMTKNLDIDFDINGRTFLNGKDVSEKIRSKEVSDLVYKVSRINKVRELMVELQRKLASDKDVIMEGRDITTVVLPNADYKFYIDASVEARAQRRFIQNQEKGINMTLDEIKEHIIDRDYNDMHKDFGTLMRTDEQIYIDTTNMTIDEVVDKIVDIIGE